MPAWGHIDEAANRREAQGGAMDVKGSRIGTQGEKATMRILDAEFAPEPDIYVFHDLRIPSKNSSDGRYESANTDHLIITGDTALVVDSKSWRPGKFVTNRNGKTRRDGKDFPAADVKTLDMAVDRYDRYLRQLGLMDERGVLVGGTRPLRWVGLVVVWPTTNTRMSLRRLRHRSSSPLLAGGGVFFCSGQRAKRLVAAICSNRGPVDEGVLLAFHHLLRRSKA